jgi:hypothetical protein
MSTAKKPMFENVPIRFCWCGEQSYHRFSARYAWLDPSLLARGSVSQDLEAQLLGVERESLALISNHAYPLTDWIMESGYATSTAFPIPLFLL